MREIIALKRKWLLLLLPIGIVIILVCRKWSFVAEYVFGRFVYKILSVIIGSITRWFPFSVAEIVIYMTPVALILLLILFVRRLVKSRGRRRIVAGKALLNMGCFISIAVFLFVVLCGTNYYRYSFAEYLDYEVTEYTKEDLYDLCVYLAEHVNEARELITEENSDGTMKLSYDTTRQFLNKAEEIISDFSKDYPSLKWCTGAAKPVIASKYMSYTDIVGIFIPYTMEANVNIDTADIAALFTDKVGTLYEHTARTATRVIYSTMIRLQHLNKCTNNARRRIELTRFLSCIGGKHTYQVFINKAKNIIVLFSVHRNIFD